MRVFVALALATAFLAPAAIAQRPTGPAPPPPTTSARPAGPTPSSSAPNQPADDRVMYLQGRVATNDGTPVPKDALVERVCNSNVRQQVHATSHGDFNMQLGSRTDSFVDASGDPSAQSGAGGKDSVGGIPRRDLTHCELRASVSGFHSDVVSLVDLAVFGTSNEVIDIGSIVVQRTAKMAGMTLSAMPYKAPQDARRAYEKGMEAENKANLASARKYFEMAVKIYPQYTSAWFQLGSVLQKEDQKGAARKAYTEATTIDSSFLPPYLSLAVMAYEAENWTEVLELTGHILERDPLNQASVTGYIVDLDPLNSAEVHFFNALANYKLNNIEAAEKSALKAEHVDLRTRFPQLHLLLAELFARKNDYAAAISEVQTYLQLAPHANDADHVREQLAKLEKLNGSVAADEKSDPK